MPTLDTGEFVQDGHPDIAIEAARRKLHVGNMFSLRDREARKTYVRAVRQKEGELAAQRLKDEFVAEHERREAARKAAAAS